LKAQGTDLYVIDPDDGSVLTVGCPTAINGIDTSVEQNETTCLNSLARTYEAGLATPGTASFDIYIDPKNASHARLHAMKIAGTSLKWAVGWSESPGTAPTAVRDTAGDDYVFDTPTTRSWLLFEGFMNSFPFTSALNAQVTSTVGIQISGEPELIEAA
jgi:tail tube protein